MNDKPVAGLVAAVAAVPVFLLCCLGPIFLGSVLGGLAGWAGGLGPAAILAAALAMAAAAYGLLRQRRRRRHGLVVLRGQRAAITGKSSVVKL